MRTPSIRSSGGTTSAARCTSCDKRRGQRVWCARTGQSTCLCKAVLRARQPLHQLSRSNAHLREAQS